jgi:hypothetical protein
MARAGFDGAFAFVYVAEAHSTLWPLGLPFVQEPTTTLAERTDAAARHVERTPCLDGDGVFVEDPAEPTFTDVFAPWPLRYYVVERDGTLRFMAQPDGPYMRFEQLQAFLATLV